MDALRGDKPDNDNLDDVKREVLVSGRPERRSGHVGHCDHATCGRIVFFGVDGTDGALRVAIVKRDETLYLLLRVAHWAGADLNLFSPRRQFQQQERRQDQRYKA